MRKLKRKKSRAARRLPPIQDVFSSHRAGPRSALQRKREALQRRLTAVSSDVHGPLPSGRNYEQAYTIAIPMSQKIADVTDKIQDWQNPLTMLQDKSTLLLGTETIVENEPLGLLTHVTVNFLFSRSGQVYTMVWLRSIVLESSRSAQICGGVWTLLLLVYTVQLVARFNAALKTGFAGKLISSIKFLIDVFIVVAGWFIVIAMLLERTATMHGLDLQKDYFDTRGSVPQNELQDYDASWLRKLHSVWSRIGRLDEETRLLICLYHITLMANILKSSQGLARLALLADTLESSFQDIVHLGIVAAFVFSAYVFAGHTLFGSKIPDYSTIKATVGSCFEQVQIMSTNWDLLTADASLVPALWTWSMLAFIGLVIINVILAVIFDNYARIKLFLTDKDSIFETMGRQMRAFRLNSVWYTTEDLVVGLRNCKETLIKPDTMKRAFNGISKEQLSQIFDLAELRALVATVRGDTTLFGEAIASILLGVDDMRDGIRRIQNKMFTSLREAKIWLGDQPEILTAPPNVVDYGPGPYVVQHNSLAVYEAKDMSSPTVAMLPKNSKVEVMYTEDLTDSSIKRLWGYINEPPGWICIFDHKTGYSWAARYKDPEAHEDSPGIYVVLHDHAAVKSDIALGSLVLDHLAAGRMVDVVEVVEDYVDQVEKARRVRARIANPDGWISLVDKDNENYRFAVRSDIDVHCGRYSILYGNTAIRSGPGLVSAVQGYLSAGEVVAIVEVRRYSDPSVDPPEERITGRIDDGVGWVTLQDLQSGHVFAELIPGKAPVPKKVRTDVGRMPREPPRWVKDGLLLHVQRSQREMVKMTQQFEQITAGLDRLGISEGWQAPMPGEKPQAPDFAQLTKPALYGVREKDAAPSRRVERAVNFPRATAAPTSKSLQTRLQHYLQAI